MSLNPETPTFFTRLVDELVDFSDNDPELKAGLQWIDEESRKRNISFYEMVFHVLHKHDSDTRAKEWNSKRN